MSVPPPESTPTRLAALPARALQGLVLLLLLNARPWRYLLSAPYRQQFDRHYARRPAAFKWLALFWGPLLVVAAASLVALAAGVLRDRGPAPAARVAPAQGGPAGAVPARDAAPR